MASDKDDTESKDTSKFEFPSTIDSDAKGDLDELAKWFRAAEMVTQGKNTWRCVDMARFQKVYPLLSKLKLDKGCKFTLYRISGYTTILKGPGFDNLFFPLLGAVDIHGVRFEPGKYTRFTSNQVVDAQLDFLIISVPEEVSMSNESRLE
ncbi:hypothetical protein HCBG_05191 [Histoplasma capsulatum G186AR]|uniref:Uncharacterized protein n=2 Tax=Ajellomyces capsulatus TaxID=5037 RepID=C0NPW1_AJECG|nr:uncharacterized protein HCBG_05191 [Histoplasma capsulatum G186AR]EEH06971.1 hypothetical protein HCBG_05191 [Histoplasma capsulatum G186AR]KAG5293998.1 hypothetical protein I7I52_05495 [Histoplasma capsulatum]QSS75450.1 hypothetical protein I7I50_04586 [Histoplasma capsulatum G186AR]